MRTREAPVALEDLIAAASCLASRPGSDIASLCRAAWVIRNRARMSLDQRRAGVRGSFGDGSIAAAADSLARNRPGVRRDGAKRIRLRAAGVMCLVLSGDIPDPTQGSVSDWALNSH